MTLAKDERIFLIILIVNLAVSLAYLLAGMFLVAIRSAGDDKEQEEILHDNRRTYLLRSLVMAMCPVVGPLFFFLGHLFYILLFWKKADLAAVVFSKERVRTRLKADEERERDIIPLEEAILVNEKKDLRAVMMSVVRENYRDSLSSITLALNSEDSEASHYAAAVLSDELNKFRVYVQGLWKQLQEESAGETQCERLLLEYMDGVLRQRVFSPEEQLKFVRILEGAAQSLYEKDPSELTLEWYEEVCLRTLEVKEYGPCKKWCARLAEQFPDGLAAYTCRLKLCFAVRDREGFLETMGALKSANVVIDSETLELIRIFS